MAQKSSKQRAEEAVLDLKGKLRQLNKTLASKGATITENAPLVATIKAVEGMTAGGGGFRFPIYKAAQFASHPDGSLPPLYFVSGFTSAYGMLQGSKIEELPAVDGWDTVTSMDNAFYSCSSLKKAIIGSATSVATLTRTFYSCIVLEVVDLTTSATLSSLLGAFYGCSALREVRGVLDVSGCTTTLSAFFNCRSLEEVRIKGLRVDLDLSACANLSVESLRYLINNAQSVSGRRIDLSRALLDANEEALGDLGDTASDKGWTINYK